VVVCSITEKVPSLSPNQGILTNKRKVPNILERVLLLLQEARGLYTSKIYGQGLDQLKVFNEILI